MTVRRRGILLLALPLEVAGEVRRDYGRRDERLRRGLRRELFQCAPQAAVRARDVAALLQAPRDEQVFGEAVSGRARVHAQPLAVGAPNATVSRSEPRQR